MIRKMIERIKNVIKEANKNIDVNVISEDTNLIYDLGFDSIDMVYLIVNLEEAFDIQIDASDLSLDNLAQVKKLMELVGEANEQ